MLRGTFFSVYICKLKNIPSVSNNTKEFSIKLCSFTEHVENPDNATKAKFQTKAVDEITTDRLTKVV